MKAIPLTPLLALGFSAAVGVELAGLAATAPAGSREPFLVIAPPWAGGVRAVVETAGGRIVGPVRAPLGALAAGAPARAFAAAGAWLVLDAERLSNFCGMEIKAW